MVVLEREEYFNRLNSFLGDTNTDESVQFLEDMTDTYNDMSSRLDGGTDWKQKYEENNAAWKKRYTERFFSGGTNNPNSKTFTPTNDDDDNGYDPEAIQVENLFTKKEVK